MNTTNEALETLKLFRIIFKSLTKHFHEIENVVGIGGASLWAVAEISENTDITVSELAKTMSIHQSTASNLIEKLVKDGYVVRNKSEIDKRSVCLKLTPQGLEMLQKAPPPYRGILPDALMKLDPRILTELSGNLTMLISKMKLTQANSALDPLGES